jgi:tetratricopeptide (TPR) repeat protein
MISTSGRHDSQGNPAVSVEVQKMSGSSLVASCCFVCLALPIASLSQPKITRNGNAFDSSASTVSVHELRIPEKARIAFNKGAQKLAAKDFAGSINEFQKAVAAYDEFYEAYYKLGIANLELQTNDAAEAAFRKSIELSEAKYAPPLFGLGLTLGNERQYEDGESYIRAGLNLEPTSAAGHFALAWVLYSAQRVVEAEKSAREAVLYNPNLANAHLLLAQIHRRQNNSAAMIEDLDAYLRLDPNGPRSRSLRTTRDEAQQSLARTADAKPDDLPAPTVDR